MAKEEKRVLTLDKYEHGVVINALNEMRNDLIGEKIEELFFIYFSVVICNIYAEHSQHLSFLE